MPDLVAQGNGADHYWRRTLPDRPIRLGRTSKSDWEVTWDMQISGLHATLQWQDGNLLVRKEPGARNRIFVNGEAADEFRLAVGDQFVIGETAFTLQISDPLPPDNPVKPSSELTCSPQELDRVKYTDADQRIEVLAALPAILRYSPTKAELEKRVLEVLLKGTPRADVVAVVWLDPQGSAELAAITVSAATRRDGKSEPIQPSRRLIVDAVRRRRQSVMHSIAGQSSPEFTVGAGVDWAICAPLADEPSPGWALYLTGSKQPALLQTPTFEDENSPKSDLKFATLVADLFSSLRQLRDLQRRQATLARFVSQPVRHALAERDMEDVLRPRETQVTVLFCDLRGSCHIAEEAEGDLMRTCARLGEALEIMTKNIIDKNGVIGDFQGDAAMGFWGWPFDDEDQIEHAARAALAIRREFLSVAQKKDHPLSGFACGIGIASGLAVAGQLGTLDQFKVSVFGPVVNLAARLESMTKRFRVPILVDERVGERLKSARSGSWGRCRRLARIRPYGMQKTLLVNELLPPTVEPGAMSEPDRLDYEAALDYFLAGRWKDARELLARLAPEVSALLHDFMDRNGPEPAAGWPGIIVMDSK